MRTILLRTAPAAGSDLLTRELRRDRARAFEVQRPNQRRQRRNSGQARVKVMGMHGTCKPGFIRAGIAVSTPL